MIEKVIAFLKREVRSRRQKKALQRIWDDTLKYCELKPLSESQVQAIQAEWGGQIKEKISPRWHQLLYSMTGVFTPKYEPFEICTAVQNKFSPIEVQRTFDDKNLYRGLLSSFNIPIRVAECVKGVYYLPETNGMVEVSKDAYLKALGNMTNCILKPASGSDGGRGVISFDTKDGMVISSNETIKEFITNYTKKFGNNYCIERKIEECDNLSRLNPSSCNTLRIHTFRNREEGKCKFISAYVRIGKKGNVVDNAHSGGLCARIYKDGVLKEAKTVYPYRIYKETESGVLLDGYRIDNYDDIVETVLKAHSSLPMFDLMGWDVAVDKNGKVIIIEFNPNPDIRMEQCIFNDSCLLDKQEEIIKLVFNN